MRSPRRRRPQGPPGRPYAGPGRSRAPPGAAGSDFNKSLRARNPTKYYVRRPKVDTKLKNFKGTIDAYYSIY